MPAKVNLDRVIQIIESNTYDCDNIGICLSCGEEQDGCEPDARDYECESCGARKVYGAEEILMMVA